MTLRDLINSVDSEQYSDRSATRSTFGRLLPKGRKKGDACLSKNLQKAKIIR